MTKIKCPDQECKKEFIKPILVTNSLFSATKETYLACPYCLTRLDSNTMTCSCTTTDEPVVETPIESPKQEIISCNEKQTIQPETKNSVSELLPLKRLEALEKQKATLIAELEELKNDATHRISKLEEEVAALKEEKQLLTQLTN